MRVAVLNSGSNGNATLVEEDGRALLIDCGISAKLCLQRTGTLVGDVEFLGILVTHEHTDHISGVGPLARRLRLTAYATELTHRESKARFEGLRTVHVEPYETFGIGPFRVTPVPVPHDAADPTGFHITTGGNGLAAVTDMGCMTDDVDRFFERSNAVIIESNHDVDMLMRGQYPAVLKERIIGPLGHMSNSDAGQAIARHAPDVAFLAHLSANNNTPEKAKRTVEGILSESGVATRVYVTRRDGPTELVDIPDDIDARRPPRKF